MEFQPLDRLSFRRFVELRSSSQIHIRDHDLDVQEKPDSGRRQRKHFGRGHLARSGQFIDASLVQVPV